MGKVAPMRVRSLKSAVDLILNRQSPTKDTVTKSALRLATPLGVGKPNVLLNALYEKFRANSEMSLEIYTALSLDPPRPNPGLEEAFLRPFHARIWGEKYPRLSYLNALHGEGLPPNIQLYEFYVSAGAFKHNSYVQQNYKAMNYTHVAENLAKIGMNVIVQLVAERDGVFSLGMNSDLTLDLLDVHRELGKEVFVVGVVHPDLPFLGGDAIVSEDFFDILVEGEEHHHKLFAVPREAITEVDAWIGLYASTIVKDGGTLQIGIGSLSDSLVRSLILRHEDNDLYRKILKELSHHELSEQIEIFSEGLYGTSELVMDGFMHLRKAGILKRTIRDKEHEIYMHAAFALGSPAFYAWLKDLKGEDADGFAMTRVSRVNDLYDPDEMALRRQRREARFFNTCMQVSLLGEAASETLPNGTIISGVGGQYNFVAMAQELRNARSVLMLRSTSVRDGKLVSNIVSSHPHATIPRHLRDVVITEYGIADIRGLSDAEVVKAILNITDSRFQEDLKKEAIKHRKLDANYQIPEWARNNLPERRRDKARPFAYFAEPFPFGSDFDALERSLLPILGQLKSLSLTKRIVSALLGLFLSPRGWERELERLEILQPENLRARLSRAAFLWTAKALVKK